MTYLEMYAITTKWLELGGHIKLFPLIPTKEMNQTWSKNYLTQVSHVMALYILT